MHITLSSVQAYEQTEHAIRNTVRFRLQVSKEIQALKPRQLDELRMIRDTTRHT